MGNLEGGSNNGDLEKSMKEPLRKGHLSPRELYERNMDGGILYCGLIPKVMLGKAVQMGVCFHRGRAFGEHGGTFLS
jgi:hypothetical protein